MNGQAGRVILVDRFMLLLEVGLCLFSSGMVINALKEGKDGRNHIRFGITAAVHVSRFELCDLSSVVIAPVKGTSSSGCPAAA